NMTDRRQSFVRMLTRIFLRRKLNSAVQRAAAPHRGSVGRLQSEEEMIGSRLTSSRADLLGLSSALSLAVATQPADAANKVLKIGFVGVTSGPAAAWGTSNVRSMQTLAAWWNEQGGIKIGNETYDINVVPFDDQKDPKRAIAGMEKMAQEGIHY